MKVVYCYILCHARVILSKTKAEIKVRLITIIIQNSKCYIQNISFAFIFAN